MQQPLSRTWVWVIIATLSLAASRLYADTGPIGTPFATFHKTSELFGFFHFAETKRENAPHGGKIISFQPSGEDFHALVTLQVTTDDHDTVQLLKLIVKRSFIDNSKTVIFAADLAKSYLAEVPVKSDMDPVAALAQEINARAMTDPHMTVLSKEPVPAPQDPPSEGYEVYDGKKPDATLTNEAGTVKVTLQNQGVGGVPVVEMTISSS